MRTTMTIKKKKLIPAMAVGTLILVTCFASDGSIICSAFSHTDVAPNRSDILAVPLNSIVASADALGTKKVARTVTAFI